MILSAPVPKIHISRFPRRTQHDTTRTQRGAALILTLVAVAIVATLCAGVGTLVVSHYERATADQDAAKALQYAEAALNFQVQRINANVLKGQIAYDGSNLNEATYSVYDIANNTGRKYPVQLRGYNFGVPAGRDPILNDFLRLRQDDECTSWVYPNLDLYNPNQFVYNPNQFVYGQATINGVTRTVRARGGGFGVFDKFTVFGINTLDIDSPSGSGGVVTIDVPSGRNTDYNIAWPSITKIANDHATYIRAFYNGTDAPYKNTISTDDGIKNFAASNDNDRVPNLPLDGVFKPREEGEPGEDVPMSLTVTLIGTPYGANYYLPKLEISTSDDDDAEVTIKADVSKGPVNLWVDSTNPEDTITGNVKISASDGDDSTKFHIYYSNSDPTKMLTIGGPGEDDEADMKIDAMIYAYDTLGSTPIETGWVRIHTVDDDGSILINGSVVANKVELGGNVTIKRKPNNGVDVGEGVLFYVLRPTWQEYQPARGN